MFGFGSRRGSAGWDRPLKLPAASVNGRYVRFGVAALAVGLGLWVVLGQDKAFKSAPDDALVSVNLQDLTWTEVARALEQGYDTAIIPTGGTEQNGPHVILGKHNYVVAAAAEQIAQKLGNTLVAPVIAFVPEGNFSPEPSLHMRFPGTISVREEVFAALLEDTARSLATHGFQRIIFIGDSAWNQPAQQTVAEALTLEWAERGIRVLQISDYYAANGQTEWLGEQGYSLGQIGQHAAMRDTSEVLAVNPDGVRTRFVPPPNEMDAGYDGAPSLASKEIGETMIALKVQAALRQITRAAE